MTKKKYGEKRGRVGNTTNDAGEMRNRLADRGEQQMDCFRDDIRTTFFFEFSTVQRSQMLKWQVYTQMEKPKSLRPSLLHFVAVPQSFRPPRVANPANPQCPVAMFRRLIGWVMAPWGRTDARCR